VGKSPPKTTQDFAASVDRVLTEKLVTVGYKKCDELLSVGYTKVVYCSPHLDLRVEWDPRDGYVDVAFLRPGLEFGHVILLREVLRARAPNVHYNQHLDWDTPQSEMDLFLVAVADLLQQHAWDIVRGHTRWEQMLERGKSPDRWPDA
jgi:hypothetical protein